MSRFKEYKKRCRILKKELRSKIKEVNKILDELEDMRADPEADKLSDSEIIVVEDYVDDAKHVIHEVMRWV